MTIRRSPRSVRRMSELLDLDPDALLSLGALRVFAKPLQPADLAAELHSLVVRPR